MIHHVKAPDKQALGKSPGEEAPGTEAPGKEAPGEEAPGEETSGKTPGRRQSDIWVVGRLVRKASQLNLKKSILRTG